MAEGVILIGDLGVRDDRQIGRVRCGEYVGSSKYGGQLLCCFNTVG